MLRVRISINLTDILDTHAVRIKGLAEESSINTYRLPDGRTFKHRYGDGANELAIKILKKVKAASWAKWNHTTLG